ncbi:MAG: hypothetical protein EPN36_02110 [Rhodanobacteraceae bacterium]|nr:MAG: hypothetical protein EPN36_02110 [Rhodanobacteraceae bacterium]
MSGLTSALSDTQDQPDWDQMVMTMDLMLAFCTNVLALKSHSTLSEVHVTEPMSIEISIRNTGSGGEALAVNAAAVAAQTTSAANQSRLACRGKVTGMTA